MRSKPKGYQPAGFMSRRDLLKAGMLALGGCLCPQVLMGSLCPSLPYEKSLSFYNLHTGEGVRAVYWSEGLYVQEALIEINQILRDFRTGEVKPIDTGLLDLLHSLQELLGSRDTMHVFSGYRSPETNAHLRDSSTGVACRSLHMEGKAADFNLPGCSLKALHKAAVALQAGGVGYYPSSDFVHVDVGRVRYW
jgi:uncharacterized protein YcbK (DUF882 family)